MLLTRLVSFISLLIIVVLRASNADAIAVLGIDHTGGIHLISTETGSYSTLGSLGLPRTHGLSRAPGGGLFTISSDDAGVDTVRRIDESNFSSTVVASGTGLTYGLGGIAFTSDDHAYITTRAYQPNSPLIGDADLVARTVKGTAFLEGFFDDILTVVVRDDGALVGIANDYTTDTNALIQINPVSARVTVISQLVGVHSQAFCALAQTGDGAYFVNSSVYGEVSEIWSIDLYTGSHALEARISDLSGITGLAPIPEPNTAMMIGLGLCLLASRRASPMDPIPVLLCPNSLDRYA